MNRQQHLIIGAIAFVAYTYLIYLVIKISTDAIAYASIAIVLPITVILPPRMPQDAIAYAFIAVVLGSVIPDILEAPTNWMHRGLGHSKRALKFTGKILVLTTLIGLFFSIFYIISSFFLGYVFHLLADATTEVGLPD